MTPVKFDHRQFDVEVRAAWDEFHKSPRNRARVEPYFKTLARWGDPGQIEHGKVLFALGAIQDALALFHVLAERNSLGAMYEAQILFSVGRRSEALKSYEKASAMGNVAANILLPLRSFQVNRSKKAFILMVTSIPGSIRLLLSSYGRAGDMLRGFEHSADEDKPKYREISVPDARASRSEIDPPALEPDNLFAQMGLPNTEERQLKATLVTQVRVAIADRALTLTQAGTILDLPQPEVLELVSGGASGFSAERLFTLLNRLGCPFRSPSLSRRATPQARHRSIGIANLTHRPRPLRMAKWMT